MGVGKRDIEQLQIIFNSSKFLHNQFTLKKIKKERILLNITEEKNCDMYFLLLLLTKIVHFAYSSIHYHNTVKKHLI